MPKIVIRHLSGTKANQVEEIPLRGFSEVLIGGEANATIRFDADREDLVSRNHARIVRDPADPNGFLLTDLGSRNGTFINRHRIYGASRLEQGDRVQLGPSGPEFTFAIDPPPAARPMRLAETAPVPPGPEAPGPVKLAEWRTLDEWLRENGAMAPVRALETLADICDAVSDMHSKGTIHGDIKSQNVQVNSEGKAKLLDAGDTPGTPENMAPEQHQGLPGDARSDVWALGVLLYEMVTGAPPFSSYSKAGSREDIMAVRYVPAARRRPGLPRPVIRMISTCLRIKPDQRYASAGVMLRDVQQLRRRLASEPWKQALTSAPAMVAAGLALLVVLLSIYALRPAPEVATAIGKDHPRPSIAASGPAATSQRTVRVATYDGPAEVTTEDGHPLGATPYSLTGPPGTNYELWLRRPGFQPRKVEVQINVDKNEYLFGLEKDEGRSNSGRKE